ncbi:MAG: DNA internalization-related competence protein ComEC/Rec2 [Clostridiales bacterium]|nr:DNA internalization-related competence protein ComEC/Rec2 [Clostridiales bacterium]
MKDFNRIMPNIPKDAFELKTEDALERFEKRPLLMPAAILFVACCLTFMTGSLVPLLVILAVLLAVGIHFVRKRNYSSFLGLVLCSCLVVFCSLRIETALKAEMPAETDGIYMGTILSCERKLSGTERITARINGVNMELRFSKDLDAPHTVVGAEFKAAGTVREPDSAGNPGEFDYKAYLKGKGILYQFRADSFSYTRMPSGLSKVLPPFSELCFRIRKGMFERFTYGRSADEKALFAAVCLGDSSLADDDVVRDFRLSGCSHLLAVSGTHFAGFLAVLPYLLAIVCPERKKGSQAYAFFAFLIACITGWSESVTRAAVMSSCAFTERDSVSAMSAAAMIMLVADPFCSCRTGFLLSFSACIAIRLLAGRIKGLMPFKNANAGFSKAVSVQFAAMLGIMPFSGLIQSRFGIAQFVSQFLGSFLAKGACILFVPGVILSCLLPQDAGYVVSSPSSFFLECLGKTVGAGGKASLEMAAGRPVEPLCLFCFWLFVFLLLMPRFSIRTLLLKISCVLLATCGGLLFAGIVRPVNAEVVFADVGQGDCCLIMAGGRACLIDGGTYEEGSSAVSDLLDYYGIAEADVAFMTHWDQDHAGGLAALHKKGRIRRIYTSYTGDDGDTEAFEKSVSLRGCDPVSFRKVIEKTEAGEVFELTDNVRLEVLYPSGCTTGGNAGSLVILMDCCGKRFLFTGDIGLEEEKLLVSENVVPDVDVLKVSHHGSRYASGSDFLEKAKPELSVISAGKYNLYGHPSPKTLERLEKAGSKVLRIDKDGAVIFSF